MGENKKMSKTEAAYIILTENDRPMSCSEIINIALKKKMIKTTGLTPEDTLRVDISNEIKRKKSQGKKQRFIQHPHGIVELAKK